MVISSREEEHKSYQLSDINFTGKNFLSYFVPFCRLCLIFGGPNLPPPPSLAVSPEINEESFIEVCDKISINGNHDHYWRISLGQLVVLICHSGTNFEK